MKKVILAALVLALGPSAFAKGLDREAAPSQLAKAAPRIVVAKDKSGNFYVAHVEQGKTAKKEDFVKMVSAAEAARAPMEKGLERGGKTAYAFGGIVAGEGPRGGRFIAAGGGVGGYGRGYYRPYAGYGGYGAGYYGYRPIYRPYYGGAGYGYAGYVNRGYDCGYGYDNCQPYDVGYGWDNDCYRPNYVSYSRSSYVRYTRVSAAAYSDGNWDYDTYDPEYY